MDNEKVRKVFYANSSPFYNALFSKKITTPTTNHFFNPNQHGYGLLTDSRSGKTVVPIAALLDEDLNNKPPLNSRSPSPAPPKKRKTTTTTNGEHTTTIAKKKKKKTVQENALDKLKIHLFKD